MKTAEYTGLCFSDEQEKQSFFHNEILKHQKLIRSIAGKYLSNPDDVDDAVQECLLLAWASMDRLRNREAVVSWLCAIARNAAIDIGRLSSSLTVSLSDPISTMPADSGITWADTLVSRQPGPEEITMSRFNETQMQKACDMLPPHYRTQLYLRCFLELETVEINRLLGIDERTRRNVCCRARLAARRNYERLLTLQQDA